MTQASVNIAQQFQNGGVVPATLVGQDAASKTYVDEQLALRDTDIANAAGVASAAQDDINAHEASTVAHPAQNITYSGLVVGAANVKQGLDNVYTRVNDIIADGDSSAEVVDARGGYPVLGDRLNASDAQLADIKKQLFIFIGDSYMVGIGGTANKIPQTISDLINCTWKNYAVGGTGFVRQVDVVDFAAQITTAANDTSVDNDAVTDIIVAGGYNDLGVSNPSQAMFDSALANINALIKTNFHYAKLTVIPFPWININYNGAFVNIQNMIINACQKIGCNYAKYALSWLVGYDSTYQSGDNIHPSDKGYTAIAAQILSVRNGTNDSKVFYGAVTSEYGSFSVNSNNNRCTINGMITLTEQTLITNLLVLPPGITPAGVIPWDLIEYGGANKSYRGFIFGTDVSLQGQIPAGTYVVNIGFATL